jgi:hypothetical protein
VGHGHSWVPFISATINEPPESCIGALGLSLAAVLMIATMGIRHVIVAERQRLVTGGTRAVRISKTAVVLGWVSAAGLLGVAAFQYVHQPIVHLIFVGVLFLCGAVHLGLLSYVDDAIGSSFVFLFVRRLCAVGFIIFAVPTAISIWGKTEILQTVAASCELLATTFYLAYLLTYFFEFKGIAIHFEAHSTTSDPILLR